jgi:hypothetical protein
MTWYVFHQDLDINVYRTKINISVKDNTQLIMKWIQHKMRIHFLKFIWHHLKWERDENTHDETI